jgi:hypothetical protein
MDTWLRDMLIAQGHMTSTGITRNARIHPCPRCKLPTIAGLDADVAAITVRCDLDEIHPRHEVDALLEDRDTYQLRARGNRYRLEPRNQFHTSTQSTTPLLVTHICDKPVNPTWHMPEQLEIPTPKRAPSTGEPQF